MQSNPMKPDLHPPHPSAVLLKKGASSLQPDVWKYSSSDGDVVLKTFERSNRLLRSTICRWISNREHRNIQLLSDFPETPCALESPNNWSVLMTYLEAEPVPEVKGELYRDYFDHLESFLSRMHAEGLNHGDLRRKNLMRFKATGKPAMVDFAQCMYFPNAASLGYRVFMTRAIQVDRVTFIKLKAWYLGKDQLSEGEVDEFARKPAHLKFGQFLKKKIYRPLKHWRQGKKRSSKKSKSS